MPPGRPRRPPRTDPKEIEDNADRWDKKFKEVDQWELDYEEVVESSSPLPEGR